jgi:uncharacterized protein with HEPN domain
LDCIQRIEADTAGGIDSFRASRTIQDAVIRNLQILAESSQRLSAQLKSRSSQVEWNRIAAFRNDEKGGSDEPPQGKGGMTPPTKS